MTTTAHLWRMEGQKNVTRSINLMDKDPESVKHIVNINVCFMFSKDLMEGHMKVQTVVATPQMSRPFFPEQCHPPPRQPPSFRDHLRTQQQQGGGGRRLMESRDGEKSEAATELLVCGGVALVWWMSHSLVSFRFLTPQRWSSLIAEGRLRVLAVVAMFTKRRAAMAADVWCATEVAEKVVKVRKEATEDLLFCCVLTYLFGGFYYLPCFV
ncbi:hypothetical protein Fmac_026818 [Flemingia macrophylla]|uniref:Uncharacterized protein n=1 Tax=Flemingia macrophylla TaxID=520843 RepID=A0ABD1LFX8_9FABA